MAIQAVIKLNIDDLQFLSTVIEKQGEETSVGYELQFRGISASILYRPERGGWQRRYKCGDSGPGLPGQNTLGWYVAYNKDQPNADQSGPETKTSYLRLK